MLEFDEPKNTPNKYSRPGRLIVVGVATLLVIGLLGFYYAKRPVAPPGQLVNLASTVNFPVYYPAKLPRGYSYTDSSSKIQSGLLYYKLHNGNKIISVTQQFIPTSSVNLQHLPNYHSLNVPAGPAAIGISIGNPSVVIATGSTLVNINSSKGVDKDSVITIASQIKPIQAKSSN